MALTKKKKNKKFTRVSHNIIRIRPSPPRYYFSAENSPYKTTHTPPTNRRRIRVLFVWCRPSRNSRVRRSNTRETEKFCVRKLLRRMASPFSPIHKRVTFYRNAVKNFSSKFQLLNGVRDAVQTLRYIVVISPLLRT